VPPNTARIEAGIHPSLRGSPIPELQVQLSTYEFRAYRKGSGWVWLHLRSTLLIEIEVSFSIEAYLTDISGHLVLPSGDLLDFERIAVAEGCDIRHNGRIQAVDLWVSVPTRLKDVKPCVCMMHLQLDVSFHGASFRGLVDREATVRRLYRR
jgi:hypothetical protein